MGTDSHRNGWDPVVNNRHGDGVDAFLGIPVGSADREGASAAGDRSRGWCGAVTPVDRRRVVANSLGPAGIGEGGQGLRLAGNPLVLGDRADGRRGYGRVGDADAGGRGRRVTIAVGDRDLDRICPLLRIDVGARHDETVDRWIEHDGYRSTRGPVTPVDGNLVGARVRVEIAVGERCYGSDERRAL